MSNRPVIVIAWGPCIDSQFYSYGMMLNRNYAQAISCNGGIPVVALDEYCAEDYVAMADGLMIPGGQFETPKPGVGQETKNIAHNYREAYQSALFDAFYKAGKPIMGICEGCQKISCCLGGTLSLKLMETKGVAHHSTAHKIRTEKGSFINDLWGDEPIVNSFHNYYIDNLGKDLKFTSYGPEGAPESIEGTVKPVFGLQFHPERMRGEECFPPDGADGNAMFRRFIEICAEIRDGK